MSEVKLFKTLRGNKIQCLACHNKCVIPEDKTGICGVRQNIGNELVLLVENRAAAIALDPIEKKPLFHFYPGSIAFSLGALGCNFSCEFCQNWDISQKLKNQNSKIKSEKNADEHAYYGEEWKPEKIVQYCQENKIPIIAYTYNEPTIWAEYALAIMKLARKARLKNIWVSNGYMSEEALEMIAPHLDAINVDLKSFQEDFYRKIAHARLQPIKENIKKIWEAGIWEEVTTLIIPGLNDSEKELRAIADFLFKISPDLPWHISAFYPAYKMTNVPPTSQASLIKAYQIGKKAGLRYVYTGNIPSSDYESTYCPECGAKIVERRGIGRVKNHLKDGKCFKCGEIIAGRWGDISQNSKGKITI